MRSGSRLASPTLTLFALLALAWTFPVHAQEEVPPPETVESDFESKTTEEDVDLTSDVERLLRYERVKEVYQAKLETVRKELEEQQELFDAIGSATYQLSIELEEKKKSLDELGEAGDPEERSLLETAIGDLEQPQGFYRTQSDLELHDRDQPASANRIPGEEARARTAGDRHLEGRRPQRAAAGSNARARGTCRGCRRSFRFDSRYADGARCWSCACAGGQAETRDHGSSRSPEGSRKEADRRRGGGEGSRRVRQTPRVIAGANRIRDGAPRDYPASRRKSREGSSTLAGSGSPGGPRPGRLVLRSTRCKRI